MGYHDTDGSMLEYISRALFDKLIPSRFGLITILKKQGNFCATFEDFKPEVIADYAVNDVGRLLGNARDLNYIWKYVDGKPITNRYEIMAGARTQSTDYFISNY